MAITQVLENQSNAQDDQELISRECQELLSSLPREKGWRTPYIFLYQGFWCQPKEIQAIISVQNHYTADDNDVIVATIPKSGTTWLKAMSFAIVNRQRFSQTNHPLLVSNPHELVPFLEYKLFANHREIPDMSLFPKPHLVGTHMPIGAIPRSVRDSKCKIVYMVRNPLDTFVSMWHFMNKLRPESLGGPISLDEAFDMYCKGAMGFGPYWDHMLGYWHESLKSPNKVLFLKYEEVREDTSLYLKKLAEFLGFPFSLEESGVVEGIAEMCSFEKMKDLEVNKKGKGAINGEFENKNLFRKGEVGDWVNLLTPLMVERLNTIMEDKLAGSGLSFKAF